MTIAVRLLLMLGVVLTAMPARAQAPAQPAAVRRRSCRPRRPGLCRDLFRDRRAAAAQGGGGILRRLAAASRKEAGNAGFVVLRESARPGRFAILEAWRDTGRARRPRHGGEGARRQVAAAIRQPARPARPASALDVAAPAGGRRGSGGGAVYVLTHVDVIPPKKDEAIALVKQLAADSRKDAGVAALRRAAAGQPAPTTCFSSRSGTTAPRMTPTSWPSTPAPSAPSCCRCRARSTTSGSTRPIR